MDRLTLVVLIVAASLFGCGSSSETTSTPSPTEGAAIAESKAAWDDQKVEAFKKAHAEDGRLTPGQKYGGQAPVAGQASK